VPIEAARGLIKLPTTNQNLSYQNVDPCYAIYWNSNWQGSSGVYTSGDFIFLWGMQALASQGAGVSPALGVDAVEDNLGDMFYYDSCIVMKNSVLGTTANHEGVMGAELMGDVALKLTPSGANHVTIYYLIGGFDMYKSYESLGNVVETNGVCYPYRYNAYVADGDGYEPTPASFVGSFSIGFTLYPLGISITYTPPSGTSGYINIYVSTTPNYMNEAGYEAYNLTWTFDYTHDILSSGTYVDGFVVGPDGSAGIFLKNYSPGNTYWFYLPFNAEVVTDCWSAWAKMAWIVGLVPSSSNAVSLNSAYFGYPPPLFQPPSNVPSGSWISGYYIPSFFEGAPLVCSGISLSGPSLRINQF
jgi:hypothetical protein